MKRLVVVATLSALTVGAWFSELSAPAAVVSCSPAVTTSSPPQAIANHLSMLATSRSLGSCTTAIRVAASGSGGVIYGVDYSGGLWRSTQGLTAWQKVYELPSGWDYIGRVLQLADGHFLLTVLDHSGLWHVVRSFGTDATSFDLARPRLSFSAGSRIRGNQSWVQAPDGSIYVGEYGISPQPVHLWRSADDGVSFQSVSSIHGQYTPTMTCECVRHIHSVQVDPYVSGRIWVAWGDTGNEPRIGYSDDHGDTFTFISKGGYYRGGTPQSRAVALDFAPDAVYWATDSPEMPAGLFRWDRTTRTITQVLHKLNGPFYDSFAFNGYFVQFSEVSTRGSDGYIGDEHIHAVTAKNNGVDWAESTLPFVRDPGHTGNQTYITGSTAPDASGDFWISMQNVAGSLEPDGVENIELHLGDAPAPIAPTPTPRPALLTANLSVFTGRARVDHHANVFIRVRCRRQARHTAFCSGILSVHAGRTTLGSAPLRLRQGRGGRVRLHIVRLLRALRAGRSVGVGVFYRPRRGHNSRLRRITLLPPLRR